MGGFETGEELVHRDRQEVFDSVAKTAVIELQGFLQGCSRRFSQHDITIFEDFVQLLADGLVVSGW